MKEMRTVRAHELLPGDDIYLVWKSPTLGDVWGTLTVKSVKNEEDDVVAVSGRFVPEIERIEPISKLVIKYLSSHWENIEREII